MTHPTSEQRRVTSTRRLFVVDDDDDSREFVAAYLRLEGFEVEEFASAEEALRALEVERPALVVTDVSLSGMSGCDAARTLRAEERTCGIPVLAVTGHHVQDLGADRRLFDAVLVKPVDVAKLVALVRGLLARTAEPARAARS